MESDDLFNSSYVPNNPSLVLDTVLWKTGDHSTIQSEQETTPDETITVQSLNKVASADQESNQIVQLQPILIEPNINNNDESFFLTTEEGD